MDHWLLFVAAGIIIVLELVILRSLSTLRMDVDDLSLIAEKASELRATADVVKTALDSAPKTPS